MTKRRKKKMGSPVGRNSRRRGSMENSILKIGVEERKRPLGLDLLLTFFFLPAERNDEVLD